MIDSTQPRGPNAPWILLASLWLQQLGNQYGALLQQMTEVEMALRELSPDQADELTAVANRAQRLQEQAGTVHEQFETLKLSIWDMVRQDTEFLQQSREDKRQ